MRSQRSWLASQRKAASRPGSGLVRGWWAGAWCVVSIAVPFNAMAAQEAPVLLTEASECDYIHIVPAPLRAFTATQAERLTSCADGSGPELPSGGLARGAAKDANQLVIGGEEATDGGLAGDEGGHGVAPEEHVHHDQLEADGGQR